MKKFISVVLSLLLACGTPVFGQMRRIPVSQIIPTADATAGCNWLTGLNAASAACARDDAYVSALAATCIVTSPCDIVFDVSIGIGAPILLPATPYATLEGIGSQTTGVFVLSGSNSTAICNAYPGYQAGCVGGTASGTAPATAGSVVIRNLGINSNRGTYPTGNSNATDARCTIWCFGVSFANLKYYELDDVYIYDQTTFGTVTSNVDRQVYRNVRIVSPSGGTNTDGIHMDGPFGTFEIDGAYLQTGDDAIAANLPEGYGGAGGGGTISNVTYHNALTGFRTYTLLSGGNCASGCALGPVSLNNLRGSLAVNNTFSPSFMLLGLTPSGTAQDLIQAISYSNVNLVNPGAWITVDDSIGSIIGTGNNVWMTPTGSAAGLTYAGSAGIGISLYKPGLTIYRGAGSGAAYFANVASGLTVQTLDLSDSRVVNEIGQSVSAIADAITVPSGGAVGTYIAPNDRSNITAATNTWTGISKAACSQFFTNVTYSLLPTASIATGCGASISDSTTQTWGATVAGSLSSYAQVTSDGTNWTVTGK